MNYFHVKVESFTYCNKEKKEEGGEGVVTDAELDQIRNSAESKKDPYMLLGVMVLQELKELRKLMEQSNDSGNGSDHRSHCAHDCRNKN